MAPENCDAMVNVPPFDLIAERPLPTANVTVPVPYLKNSISVSVGKVGTVTVIPVGAVLFKTMNFCTSLEVSVKLDVTHGLELDSGRMFDCCTP